jgi:hypothetical protein
MMPGPNNLPGYGATSSTRLQLIPAVIGKVRLFRLAEMSSAVFCDQIMKDACEAAELKGVFFRKISKE